MSHFNDPRIVDHSFSNTNTQRFPTSNDDLRNYPLINQEHFTIYNRDARSVDDITSIHGGNVGGPAMRVDMQS